MGFTDHPARQADSYDVATVFSLLFNGQTPPDAALEYDHGSGHRVTVLEISKPSYDGDSGTLKLHAKILEHPENELHPGSALVDFAARQDPRLPSSFTAPTLFVDSGLTAGEAQPSATASGGNCEPRNYLAEFDVYLSAVCTFEGIVKPWSPVDHDVRCSDFEDPPYKGFPQYIERRPNDPPTIADQPRIDKHDTPTRKVHISWVATDSDFNQLLSRRVTAIRISLGTSPLYGDQHYKVSVWCGTVNGAWIIAG